MTISSYSRTTVGRHIPLEIPSAPMNKNGDEEQGVEIRDGGGGADNQPPCKAHNPVCHVILLSDFRSVAAAKEVFQEDLRVFLSISTIRLLKDGFYNCM